MACHALGRCRICARKHKIAVFGSEEAQHVLIEKSNLKLIILNTVCVHCIAKIESFVNTVNGASIFGQYIKGLQPTKRDKNPHPIASAIQSRPIDPAVTTEIKKELPITNDHSADALGGMDVVMKHHDNSPNDRKSNLIENETLAAKRSCTSGRCAEITGKTDRAPPQYYGDSPAAAVSSSFPARLQEVRAAFARKGSTNTASRKRPRNVQNNDKATDKDEERNLNPCTKLLKTTDATVDRKADSSLLGHALAMSAPIVFPDHDSSHSPVPSQEKTVRFLCCEFCKKEFTHAGDLNKHRRKHTGEKPYECNQCERKFAHASNLARHQRTHSGERPYACPRCTRRFTRRDKLVLHVSAARCQPDTSRINISHTAIESQQISNH